MATISIDLDNVIRDQIGSVIEAAERRYKVQLARKMFNQWDPPLGEKVGLSNEAFTRWAWTCPLIAAQAQPVPGAVEALTWLSRYHRIIITTATANPSLTEPWLKWWGIPFDNIVHTADKSIVAFDLHIDDSPKELVRLAQAGYNRQTIRFDQPWNRCLHGLMPSLDTWQAIERVLAEARQGVCAQTGEVR